VQHDARPQRDKGNDPSAAGIGIGDRVEVEPGALSRIAVPGDRALDIVRRLDELNRISAPAANSKF